MGVELSAVAVDWPVLLSRLEEKPSRLRRASFIHGALEKGEPWIEDLSEALDPTDSTMIESAQAYDRIRESIEPHARELFDRFTGAFFWMWTEGSPFGEPPVRDLGPHSDKRIFFSSFAPESVASYVATWRQLNLESLRGPFELGKGHLAYGGSKARNSALFEGRFRPYFAQWGEALEAASAKGRGLLVSFQ